jgi:hypothetical protein
MIDLHPKAMPAIIQVGEEDPDTVLTYIRRYPYFTSIKAMTPSIRLGKYLFINTKEHFNKAKQFVKDTLPYRAADRSHLPRGTTHIRQMPKTNKFQPSQ